MLGTAFPAGRVLLVEQPFPWGFQGLRSSRFDRATALALEARCREETVRVQAIRRPGRTAEGTPRRWVLVDARGRPGTMRTGTFEADAELLDLPLDGSSGAPDPEPLFLVCTHGKHDPCCGQRGRPLVVALEAERPGRVWQVSHVGGCRFAPSVLVVPQGLVYGRVPPSHAAGLVAATARGEVVLEHLRGRIGVVPVVQAALGFAQEHVGTRGIDDVSARSAVRGERGVVVTVSTPQGRFAVTVRNERVDARGLTCAAAGDAWFVAHRLASIEPA
jgi:(2Fe-2S) ferredoxin